MREGKSMRIWHQRLIHLLPRQQLLGQHRELAALRGMGWGRKHATVDYVFKHDPALLVAYHYCIIEEMERRGYHPDRVWVNPDWRGSVLGEEIGWADKKIENTNAYETYLLPDFQTKKLLYDMPPKTSVVAFLLTIL